MLGTGLAYHHHHRHHHQHYRRKDIRAVARSLLLRTGTKLLTAYGAKNIFIFLDLDVPDSISVRIPIENYHSWGLRTDRKACDNSIK